MGRDLVKFVSFHQFPKVQHMLRSFHLFHCLPLLDNYSRLILNLTVASSSTGQHVNHFCVIQQIASKCGRTNGTASGVAPHE